MLLCRWFNPCHLPAGCFWNFPFSDRKTETDPCFVGVSPEMSSASNLHSLWGKSVFCQTDRAARTNKQHARSCPGWRKMSRPRMSVWNFAEENLAFPCLLSGWKIRIRQEINNLYDRRGSKFRETTTSHMRLLHVCCKQLLFVDMYHYIRGNLKQNVPHRVTLINLPLLLAVCTEWVYMPPSIVSPPTA